MFDIFKNSQCFCTLVLHKVQKTRTSFKSNTRVPKTIHRGIAFKNPYIHPSISLLEIGRDIMATFQGWGGK
jgi:hypothetical protein